MAGQQILNLDSLVDRPTIIIGEKEYWLLTLDILPPLDAHRLQRWGERVTALMDKPVLTADEEAELKQLPDRMCRMVLEAPEDVLATLSDRVRMLIAETAVTTFRSGLRRTPPSAAATTAAEDPSTGESGSRA